MFKKTHLKLAGLYLTVIMAISLLFSVNIYYVSVREVDRGFGMQARNLEPALRPGGPIGRSQFITERQEILDDIRMRVIGQLILVNLAILVGAGALSYFLARRTLQPIEEAHKSLERFTADASHELRTPITAMKSEIEVSLSDPKLNLKGAKSQLASNLEELDKLQALSDGLLRLARMDASELPREPVAISDILQAAVERVLPDAEKKKILLNLTDSQSLSTYGDKTSLVEAFVTILDNAVKYSPKSSEVIVKIDAYKHHARVQITDQGVGIKATELPHIFDRFYRADSSRTKSNVDGYGLGLAIAKNIFDMHSGTVVATSQQGKGTTFSVSLPLAR